MSRRPNLRRALRVIDLYCLAVGWHKPMLSVTADLAENPTWPQAWKDEAAEEIRDWTAKRDRIVVRLRKTIAELTPEEKSAFASGKCGGTFNTATRVMVTDPEVFRSELREVGAEPNW